MQKKYDKDVEKVQKTGVVFAVANLFLLPFYYADSKLGVTASIALTFAGLYGLHELGKERRPVENMTNTAQNFFRSGSTIENAFNNIIEGGDAVFSEVRDGCSHNGKK